MVPFQIFHSEPCMQFSSDMRATCTVYLIQLNCPIYIWWAVQVKKLLPHWTVPPSSRYFLSSPFSRYQEGGGRRQQYNYALPRLISVFWTRHRVTRYVCTDVAQDLNSFFSHFAVKSSDISLSVSVPDCGWWGSSQAYTAFCIQPARSTWLLWQWGSCKFAWLHTRITLDTVHWVVGRYMTLCMSY